MNKIVRTAAATLAAFIALTGAASAATKTPKASKPVEYCVTGSPDGTLVLRATPSRTAKAVDTLINEECGVWITRTAPRKAGFVKVSAHGQTGWMLTKYLITFSKWASCCMGDGIDDGGGTINANNESIAAQFTDTENELFTTLYEAMHPGQMYGDAEVIAIADHARYVARNVCLFAFDAEARASKLDASARLVHIAGAARAYIWEFELITDRTALDRVMVASFAHSCPAYL